MDYIGAVQGIPVCFDAKECAADTFPLQNVHQHQVEFMERFEKQKESLGHPNAGELAGAREAVREFLKKA